MTWSESRIPALLGLRHAIVQGPFGGGASSVDLAVAVSDGGALGSYGANNLAPAAIAELVALLRSRTSAPFNVNLWVPLAGEREARLAPAELDRHVARLRAYLDELGVAVPTALPPAPDFERQIEALLAAGPPVISFVFGCPPAEVLAEARRRDIRVLATATTVDEAVVLDEAGVDAIVASGSDAGGHRGAFLRRTDESLVGTFSLVPQVVDAVRAPVIAAGGIADARGVRAARALGAEGVQVGTAFLLTHESAVSEPHRAALTGPAAGTTVLTAAFTGRLARALPNRVSRELADQAGELPPYPLQGALTAPMRAAAAAQNRPEFLNLWSGQSARLARPVGAAQLIEELTRS